MVAPLARGRPRDWWRGEEKGLTPDHAEPSPAGASGAAEAEK